jgi:putative endonuclease
LKFFQKISYVPPDVLLYLYSSKPEKKSLYIGYTANLKRRFESHNNGQNLATKVFIPYKLIYYEAFLNRIDVKNREEYLKGGYGRRTIKILLINYLKNKK